MMVVFIVLFFFLTNHFICDGIEFYYRSNSIGLQYEIVSRLELDKYEYTLGIEKQDIKEIRRLYLWGEEEKRWEISLYSDGKKKEVREYIDKVLIKIEYYSTGGNLIKELEFEEEQLKIEVNYTYDQDNRLIELEVFDGNNNSIQKEHYFYTEQGYLREVCYEYPQGEKQIVSYIFGEEMLVAESTLSLDTIYISRFNKEGKLISTETWEDGMLIARINRNYNPDTGTLESVLEEDFVRDTKIEKKYDESGELVSESDVLDKSESKEFFHDESGRLIRMRKISEKGMEEWEYEYDEEGEIQKEIYYLKGSIVKTIQYTASDEWYEELYKEGVPFLRVYYRKEEKIKEEFLK